MWRCGCDVGASGAEVKWEVLGGGGVECSQQDPISKCAPGRELGVGAVADFVLWLHPCRFCSCVVFCSECAAAVVRRASGKAAWPKVRTTDRCAETQQPASRHDATASRASNQSLSTRERRTT